MSFCKCVKHACIQVHAFQLIIKCEDDIRVRVQNSDASNFKYSTLVVVIVVHYYSSIQSSVLRTNQDFHTQMWQEKSDLGTMNKNAFEYLRTEFFEIRAIWDMQSHAFEFLRFESQRF